MKQEEQTIQQPEEKKEHPLDRIIAKLELSHPKMMGIIKYLYGGK